MIKIAVMGYGTIGSGVVEVLEKNRDIIAKRAGDEITVKYILDLREFPGDPHEDILVHDYEIIRSDPEILAVVECMGGVEPAHTFAREAILAGKHFATSNKALIAEYGPELIALAQERNLNCLFEASVGGGIPIIRPLNSCLTADVIEEISGILNGTTNYMMTKMSEEGSEFDEVLKDAQQKGFAEADPTADIEGYDACRKIAILTSLICGNQVDYEDIPTQGISGITATDIRYATAMGRKIKLIASSYKTENGYCAFVAPVMLAPGNALHGVDGVFNAIFVKGNMLGDAMFYGSGAGKLPTASAVVADIVDIVRHKNVSITMQWSADKMVLEDARQLSCRYFVRTTSAKDRIGEAFGPVQYVSAEGITGETAFVTEEMDGFAFEERLAGLKGVRQWIRVN
ncbi:MAG: homoserine dehydrogenase [Lachnospiraceae bacterium]|nr:homoserine dehydrogenase [Lachnospiraceae bacterium]